MLEDPGHVDQPGMLLSNTELLEMLPTALEGSH